MIVLSQAAQKNVRDLAKHYKAKNYTQAAKYLRDAIEQAKIKITANPNAGAPCPRPYPTIKIQGLLWLFEHRYWIAYRPQQMTITGVFYDEADIPSHAKHL